MGTTQWIACRGSGKCEGIFASIQLVPARRLSIRKRNWPGVALGIVAMGLIAACWERIITSTFSLATGIRMPSITMSWMKFAACSPSPLS